MPNKVPILSEEQLCVVNKALDVHQFIEGPAGCGKTTAGVARMLALVESGVGGDKILVIVPQRTLAAPYYEALQKAGVLSGGVVSILTIGGLAQRLVDIFWPLIAEVAGFGRPDEFPRFLTLETAQYYMARLVEPLLKEGLFESVVINPNRLYSQIIDNLNKAAIVGFPYTQIGERLKSSCGDDPGRRQVFDDVQRCATQFREFCLANNLLDFSLQLEVFSNYVWNQDLCRKYLRGKYHHLIVDNIEEDTPFAHDLLIEWLPDFESVLIIYDWDAGYRRFLGADPLSAEKLKRACTEHTQLTASFVTSPEVQALQENLSLAIRSPGAPISALITNQTPAEEGSDHDQDLVEVDQVPGGLNQVLIREYHRFYPEMLDWVANQVHDLVSSNRVRPSEIVILAPYVSDSLRFSVIQRLQDLHVPVRSHRPSRALRDEPVTQCLLTLSAICHPEWGYLPTKFDFAYALVQAIDGLDLVRAQLLSEIVYRTRHGDVTLSSFDPIKADVQERITYRFGERYEQLRLWIEEYRCAVYREYYDAFDYFLSRLFGEVLSQPGFGFHVDYYAGEVTANLIESVQKFRFIAGDNFSDEKIPPGKEYLKMVSKGVIAAQYIRSWDESNEDAVLLTPAYTFLMRNRPVDVQFWLDVGSRGWYQRLNQPLTHPYVLSRNWQTDRLWREEDEFDVSQQILHTLIVGLLRRCRKRVYLGLSDLGEQGYEQRGLLLSAFQRVLRWG